VCYRRSLAMQLKQKGERIRSPFLVFVVLELLLGSLRSLVMCLVRVRMTPVTTMSMVAMMFLGGRGGFCRCFRLGEQNDRYCK
jgi:hypothetical protein